MDHRELQQRLGQILAHEEMGGLADWNEIERLSHSLDQDLGGQGPKIVLDYLTSFHFRRLDQAFAQAQREAMVTFLRGQEF